MRDHGLDTLAPHARLAPGDDGIGVPVQAASSTSCQPLKPHDPGQGGVLIRSRGVGPIFAASASVPLRQYLRGLDGA
eukprot:11182126-Lingulodinium_polyedra.AAC.1